MKACNAAVPSGQLAAILTRQRDAFLQDGPPSLQQRRADLKVLRALVLDHRREIEAALIADFGYRSPHETRAMEILPLIQGIAYLQRHLPRFMRPRRRHVAASFRMGAARVEYQPLGVIGIVAPWNYPLSLALKPLATALAAGNRAMIKPSEFTPATSVLLAGILGRAFAPDKVAVVQGDAAVGAAFAGLPFDHLLFTGSTQVGRAVMRSAAEHLVPLTLELGGKSPALIGPGHVTDRAVSSIAYGKLANAGQTCVAPDYVIVHEDEAEAFILAYGRAVARLYPKGPASADYTSIINDHHVGRLNDLLADAAAKGARIVPVGIRAAAIRPRIFAPLLVLDPSADMAIMQQEIFGPVLPVVTCRDIDAAIAYVNARPRPLALYYFGAEDATCRRVLARTVSGNVGINNTLMHYAQTDLPFGGVGASGMGAYHGIEGFRTMSHAKGVYAEGRLNGTRLLRAPFGRFADLVLKVMLRR